MAKIKKIMSTLSQNRWWPLFLVACFLGAIFLFQIMHLVGDPSPLKRIGDIGDEGYWIHNARSRVLFGTSLPDQFNQAYIGATLYNYLLVIIFKIAGVSLFSARFLSLLAFWIILVVFFKLVKKYYGLRVALVSTLLFGITNEALMYVKWSTPVPLEMLSLFLILFFFDLGGENKKSFWYIVSGAFYPIAFFCKLSSTYFILPLVIFFIVLLLTQKTTFNKIFLFITGSVSALILYLLFFGLKNREEIKFFMNSIGTAHSFGSGGVLYLFHHFSQSISTILDTSFFTFPSIVLLIIIVIALIWEMIIFGTVNGIAKLVRKINILEIFSFSWLIGMIVMISLSFDQLDRRFVMFITPLFLLASSFFSAKFKNTNKIPGKFDLRIIKFVCFIFFLVIFKDFLVKAFLTLATTFCSGYIQRLTLFNLCLILASLITAAVFSYSLVIAPKKRIYFTGTVILLYLIINLFVNIFWYSTDQYTLVKESAKLKELIATHGIQKIYFSGWYAHELAIGNPTFMPIWFLKSSVGNYPINPTFFIDHKTEPVLISQGEFISDLGVVTRLNDSYLNSTDYQKNEKVMSVCLFPNLAQGINCQFSSTIFLSQNYLSSE